MTTDTGKFTTVAEASSWLRARSESYRRDAQAFDTMTDLADHTVWAANYRAVAHELHEASTRLVVKEG